MERFARSGSRSRVGSQHGAQRAYRGARRRKRDGMSYQRALRGTQLEQRLHDELCEVLKRESLTSFSRRHQIDPTGLHRFLKEEDRTLTLRTAGKLSDA